MGNQYEDFLRRKARVDVPTGIAGEVALSPKLFEHQRLLTQWALRRGRAAIFASTGLGKGFMILEWSRVVAEHMGKPVLVLAPLAVSQQFVREAEKLGTGITICSSQADVRPGVNVTNYQKLHKFDLSHFGGIAVDESSILKHLDGHYRRTLIEQCKPVPFRLSATATPSPNDHMELGGQAEFLGILSHTEMLARYFVHDGSSTQDWRLKGHAVDEFWSWVCSWGAFVQMPSDLGCSDDGYVLPPLRYHEHVVSATEADAKRAGKLFAERAETLSDQRAARRGTLEKRAEMSAAILNATEERGICWCDHNAESELLSKLIRGAVEVTGSQDDDEKEAAIDSFISGERRVMVTKPSLAGFGLNMQFARRVAFCGVSHSWEQFFQAIRRSWRFGVSGEVNVHVVVSELEGKVLDNLKRKQGDADERFEETKKHVERHVRASVVGSSSGRDEYKPNQMIEVPSWVS